MTHDHRDLRIFKEADDLVVSVYRVSTDMPSAERYGLQAQVRRAAVSVACNIVEGTARASATEKCRFLEIARSSARECEYLLDLSMRLSVVRQEEVRPLVARYGGLQAGIRAAAVALTRSNRPSTR